MDTLPCADMTFLYIVNGTESEFNNRGLRIFFEKLLKKKKLGYTRLIKLCYTNFVNNEIRIIPIDNVYIVYIF